MDEQHSQQTGFERFLEVLTEKIEVGWPGADGEILRGFRVYLDHGHRVVSTRAPSDDPNSEPGQGGISIPPRRT